MKILSHIESVAIIVGGGFQCLKNSTTILVAGKRLISVKKILIYYLNQEIAEVDGTILIG